MIDSSFHWKSWSLRRIHHCDSRAKSTGGECRSFIFPVHLSLFKTSVLYVTKISPNLPAQECPRVCGKWVEPRTLWPHQWVYPLKDPHLGLCERESLLSTSWLPGNQYPFLPCPVIHCPTTGIKATGPNDHKLKLCKQQGQMNLSWSEIGSVMLWQPPKIEHWLQPLLNRWIHYRVFVFRSLRLEMLPRMGVVRMNF